VIAALFVQTNGSYYGLPDVDPWDEKRDARKYAGPWPVVAHPPCERWGRYWGGGPSAKVRRKLGDDNGCFRSAYESVYEFGGVLEHPEASHAFKRFGLGRPVWRAGWMQSDDGRGQICCVAQGNYGHRARKLTWLYYVGRDPLNLDWSIPSPRARLDLGFHSALERRAASACGIRRNGSARLTTNENLATPRAFRDVLIQLAKSSVQ
jgi:hypothetical protein